jgi:hypothetical protein
MFRTRLLGVTELFEEVLRVILYAHQKEEPTIDIREEWSGRSNYQLNNDNSNGWWNDGREIPEMVKFGFET